MNFIKKIFKSYIFNVTLIILLASLVVWVTVKDNPKQIIDMLQSADLFWLSVVMILVILMRCVVGIIIKLECSLSCPNYKISYGIINSFVASLFNGITPSDSGGQFAQVFIFKKQGVDYHQSASVLWMDFIIYQSTMVISVLLLIIVKLSYFYHHYSQFFIIVIFGFLVNASVIVGLYALFKFPKFYKWLTTTGFNIAHFFHIIKDKEKTLAKVNDKLEQFDAEIQKLTHHRKLIFVCVCLNIVRLFLYYVTPFFCAKALHIPVYSKELFDILALTSFVCMVNSFNPLPGASGGTEATFVLMFSTIFGKISATSIMIFWRFMSYYFLLLVGFFVFIYVKNKPNVQVETENEK